MDGYGSALPRAVGGVEHLAMLHTRMASGIDSDSAAWLHLSGSTFSRVCCGLFIDVEALHEDYNVPVTCRCLVCAVILLQHPA